VRIYLNSLNRDFKSRVNNAVSFKNLLGFIPQALISGKQEDLSNKVFTCLSCVGKTFIEAFTVSRIQEAAFQFRFTFNGDTQTEVEHVISDAQETVSHHFPESAGMSADAFIHTAALLQSALAFGRIQTITASTNKAFIRKPGISSSLALNQSNEV
jgi:hypothetical protein